MCSRQESVQKQNLPQLPDNYYNDFQWWRWWQWWFVILYWLNFYEGIAVTRFMNQTSNAGSCLAQLSAVFISLKKFSLILNIWLSAQGCMTVKLRISKCRDDKHGRYGYTIVKIWQWFLKWDEMYHDVSNGYKSTTSRVTVDQGLAPDTGKKCLVPISMLCTPLEFFASTFVQLTLHHKFTPVILYHY